MNVPLPYIFHAHLSSTPTFFMVFEFIARATSLKCGSWDLETERTSRFQLLLNKALGSFSHSTASTNRHLIHAKLVSDLTHLWLFEDVSLGGGGIRVEGVRNSRAAAKTTCPYQLPPWLQEELLTSSSPKSKMSSKCQPILMKADVIRQSVKAFVHPEPQRGCKKPADFESVLYHFPHESTSS